MTRIDFKLPQFSAAPAPGATPASISEKGLSGISVMLTSTRPQGAVTPGMLTARIEGTMRLARDLASARSDPHAHAQARTARQALRNLASELTDATTGRVHGGYLSLSANGQALANTSRWASGNRSGAVEQVRDLIGKAYGAQLQERGIQSSVDESIKRYLARSGGKLGTKSLVGLVRELEKKIHGPSDFLAKAQAQGARLDTTAIGPTPLSKDPQEFLQRLNSRHTWPQLYELYAHATQTLQTLRSLSQPQTAVQRTVQASALAVIESNYAWAAADSTRVGEHALTPDVPDYQILNFGQLKLMEQLASERGIPAAGFFALLQVPPGSDQLIDPAGANHPHPLGRQLHANLGRAFTSATTLDDFHNQLAKQALAIDEERRLSQA